MSIVKPDYQGYGTLDIKKEVEIIKGCKCCVCGKSNHKQKELEDIVHIAIKKGNGKGINFCCAKCYFLKNPTKFETGKEYDYFDDIITALNYDPKWKEWLNIEWKQNYEDLPFYFNIIELKKSKSVFFANRRNKGERSGGNHTFLGNTLNLNFLLDGNMGYNIRTGEIKIYN